MPPDRCVAIFNVALMRMFVALVVVALFGVAAHAQTAAAGSSQPQRPGLSVSVDLGLVSVDANVTAPTSTDGESVEATVSAPSTSVEASVDSASTEAPAAADVSLTAAPAEALANTVPAPVEGLAADVQVAPESPLEGTAVQVGVQAPLTQASAQLDISGTRGIEAAVRVKSPTASSEASLSTGSRPVSASIDVSTPIAATKAAVAPAAPARASNEGSAVPIAQPSDTVRLPSGKAVLGPAARVGRATASPRRGKTRAVEFWAGDHVAALAHAHGAVMQAAPTSEPLILATGSGASARLGGAFGALLAAVAPQPAQANPERRPAHPAAPSDVVGLAAGSGPSASFVAILTLLLMLAVPFVGRWLRPTTDLVPQPAIASLPERPG